MKKMLMDCYNQQKPGDVAVCIDAWEDRKMVSTILNVNIDIFHKAPRD